MSYHSLMILDEDFSSHEKRTSGLHITWWWQNQLNQDRETSNVFPVWSCCVQGITAKLIGHIPLAKRSCPLVLGSTASPRRPGLKPSPMMASQIHPQFEAAPPDLSY